MGDLAGIDEESPEPPRGGLPLSVELRATSTIASSMYLATYTPATVDRLHIWTPPRPWARTADSQQSRLPDDLATSEVSRAQPFLVMGASL